MLKSLEKRTICGNKLSNVKFKDTLNELNIKKHMRRDCFLRYIYALHLCTTQFYPFTLIIPLMN